VTGSFLAFSDELCRGCGIASVVKHWHN